MIARSLVRAFRECGHACEEMRTPQNRFGRQLSAYVATALMDVGVDGLGREIDLVVSFRFPSYAVRHKCHVCWLNHRMREYYDLWERFRQELSVPGRVKETLRRRLMHALDGWLLKKNVKRLYAQSSLIQSRLRKWGDIPSLVLYPPPPQREYETAGYEKFVFCPSRLDPLKRPELLIEALALLQDKELRCVISGDGGRRAFLEDMIREKGLQERVRLTGFISDAELLDYYSRCLAVFFAPYNEDYGFVTPEAFMCRKPVLTCTDSGGASELVTNGVNGFVCAPEAACIGEKLDVLAADSGLAAAMGEKGFARVSALSWEGIVSEMITGDKYGEFHDSG